MRDSIGVGDQIVGDFQLKAGRAVVQVWKHPNGGLLESSSCTSHDPSKNRSDVCVIVVGYSQACSDCVPILPLHKTPANLICASCCDWPSASYPFAISEFSLSYATYQDILLGSATA